jgi:hypothetical protein
MDTNKYNLDNIGAAISGVRSSKPSDLAIWGLCLSGADICQHLKLADYDLQPLP